MTQIEAKLLDELEALENARRAELDMLQKELSTIQQQQKQILQALQKGNESEGLEEILTKALSKALSPSLSSLSENLNGLSETLTSLQSELKR